MWPVINLLVKIVFSAPYITEGTTQDISIALSKEPAENVVLVAQYGSRFSLSADTITFTPANWSTTQQVSITPTALAAGVGLDTFVVSFLVFSDDTEYNNYPCQTLRIVVFDNEWTSGTQNTDVSGKFHYTDTDISELAALRDTFMCWLFPSCSLPSSGVDSVVTGMTYNTYMNPAGMDSLGRVDKLLVTMDSNFVNNVYHLIPTSRNNKLMIVGYGHGDAYDVSGVPTALEYWITRGYDVITSHQVNRAENTGPLDALSIGVRHDSLRRFEAYFNPLKLFLEHTIRAVNYLDSINNYENIYMCGISGGGMETTMLSAIDARIEKSFEVAGTYPIYIRAESAGSVGDYEQGASATRSSTYIRNFFADKVSYLDLYALCSFNREHWQMLNKSDNCCFEGVYWKHYLPELRRRVQLMPSGSSFNFYQDDFVGHAFSLDVLNLINSRL